MFYMGYIINKRIKELRKECKLTQKELAERCIVKQSCVSKWERGETLPDTLVIIKLCEVFQVSADYLLGIKDY